MYRLPTIFPQTATHCPYTPLFRSSRTSPPGGAGRPEGGSDRPRDRRDRPSTATASVRAAGRTLDNESRPSLGFIGVIYEPHLAIRFLRSEEHTSELQSLIRISYAVFCLKKKKADNPISPRLT